MDSLQVASFNKRRLNAFWRGLAQKKTSSASRNTVFVLKHVPHHQSLVEGWLFSESMYGWSLKGNIREQQTSINEMELRVEDAGKLACHRHNLPPSHVFSP
jgi:hypothetical protein